MGKKRSRSNLGVLIGETLSGNTTARNVIWSRRDLLDRAALIARTADRDARNAVWIVARPQLERIARGYGVRPDDVPDLVQETLLTAYRHLRRFDPSRGSFRAWLVTILIHLRKNLLRSRARGAQLIEAAGDELKRREQKGCSPVLAEIESELELRYLLSLLTCRQRTVLVLAEIGGLSAAEIGHALGVTAEGARSIARDARNRLARKRRRSAR